MKKIFYPILILCLMACGKNAFDQYQKGDTEAAYKTLLKKAKKHKLDRDEVKLFRKVIQEMVLEDSISYHRLISYGDLTNNMEAYYLHDEMNEREEEISKLKYSLPNYYFLSRNAFDDLSSAITDALFEDGNYLLAGAIETGDKNVAREAYDVFLKMQDFHTYIHYPLEAKIIEAERLGTEFVLINLEANTFSNDWDIERHMDFDDLRLRDGNWRVYHERSENVEYAMLIDVVVERARFTDDVSSQTRVYNDRVISHYETQTDTSGVSTQIPVYQDITATVITDNTRRTLYLDGEVEVREINGSRYDDDISRYYYEDGQSHRYTGDLRAVPDDIERDLNRPPVFSNDSEFYRNTVEAFLEEAGDIIERLN